MGNAIDHDRVFQSYQVNPATTTFTTGYCTVFVAEVADGLTGFIEQFCRERTCTYASAIGLHDAIDIAYLVRTNTQACTSTGTNRIRRSYKWIRAEIDIQHGTLRTFAKHTLSGLQQVVDFVFAIHQMKLFQVFNGFQPFFFQRCNVVFIVHALQDLFMTSLCLCILFFKVAENISYTQSVTTYFVGICGADALTGCSYLCISLSSLVCRIQHTMSRHDKMGFLGDVQTFLQRVSAGFQRNGFSFEQSGIKHHSIANDIHFIALENS